MPTNDVRDRLTAIRSDLRQILYDFLSAYGQCHGIRERVGEVELTCEKLDAHYGQLATALAGSPWDAYTKQLEKLTYFFAPIVGKDEWEREDTDIADGVIAAYRAALDGDARFNAGLERGRELAIKTREELRDRYPDKWLWADGADEVRIAIQCEQAELSKRPAATGEVKG